MHLDHCMGILPLMNSAMRSSPTASPDAIRLELYGPAGLRKLVRTNLEITRPNLSGKYRTHELLSRGDAVTSCEDGLLHENELSGRDIHCDQGGHWRDFESSEGFSVDAGSIVHRVPCLGYIFKESPPYKVTDDYLDKLDNIPRAYLPPKCTNPRMLLKTLLSGQSITLENGTTIDPPLRASRGRKIVILGDTSDASGVEDLAQDADLLVHEATNAYMPLSLDERAATRTPEIIREKAIGRGHSTPDMAGAFARRIKARQLYLNHFSARFPDAGPPIWRSPSGGSGISELRAQREHRVAVLNEIERQASETWGMGEAHCARDLWVVDVPSENVGEGGGDGGGVERLSLGERG